MGIKVSWFDHGQTALLWKVNGDWSVDDYSEAARQTYALTHHNQRYHIIVDLTQAGIVPPTIITVMRNHHLQASKRYNGSIMFGASPSLSMLLGIVGTLSALRGHFFFVESRDAAWKLHTERLDITAQNRG